MSTVFRVCIGALTLLITGLGLGGCSLMPTSGICVSWAYIETPQDALNDSTLTIVGQPQSTDQTLDLLGEPAAVHKVEVQQVLKGDASVGDTLSVISTPVTCTGDEVYRDGDPLDTQDTLVFFLIKAEEHDEWRTISPLQGVLAVSPEAEPSLDAW